MDANINTLHEYLTWCLLFDKYKYYTSHRVNKYELHTL